MKKKKKMGKEKRKYRRFPTISMIKEIMISSMQLRVKSKTVPAIMFNLSAGGIAIITFVPIPKDTLISLKFNLGGLKLDDVQGKVVRAEGKGNTYLAAIAFTKIKESTKKKIKEMADDFDRCETKILLGEKNVCFRSCRYYNLCTKNIKKKWRKTSS